MGISNITIKPNNTCAYLMFYGKIFKIILRPIYDGFFQKPYNPMWNSDVAVDLTHLVNRDDICNEMKKSIDHVIHFKVSQAVLEGV